MEECASKIVKGSPSTLLLSCGGETYVVDPGHGRKRSKQIGREIARSSSSRVVFVVTHFHSDHHIALAQGLLDIVGSTEAVVVAPRRDAPAVRDPLLRVTLTFGYPLGPGSGLLLYEPLPVRVDLEIDPGSSIGPLRLEPLPGHTPGQVGVVTSDGLLYAADSLFGEKVLDRYGVPYHFDPCTALETLEGLRDRVSRFEGLQPSHGPMVRGGDAERLVELNIESVEGLIEAVRESVREPSTLPQAAASVASRMGSEGKPGFLMLVENTVRGVLSCLHMRGEVEALTVGHKVVWRASRT